MHPGCRAICCIFLKVLLNRKNGTKFVIVIHKELKMSNFPGRLAGFIMCGFLLVSFQQKAKAQDVEVSYQTFYDELSPYGQWVYDGEYGNVWVPDAEPGFRPYGTNGHWVMTENGNMWVSDVPWGWACYHYGRWTFNPYYGWIWVPGHEWAPAWVTWRSGGGYYGWAPMGPGVSIGMSYDYPENYWVFVEPTYLYSPSVYTYYEPRHTGRYIRRTTIINDTYVDNGTHATYYYGPRRETIERETHQPVQVYNVRGANAPRQTNVGRGEVSVYRPMVNRNTVSTARPANVVRASEPIGRPMEVSREYNSRQPEFRQQMQQNQGGRGTEYNGRGQNRYNEPVRTQPDNRFDSRNNNAGRQEPVRQDNNRPQPGRFGQPDNRQQSEPRYNREPERQQQENRQPMDQRYNRQQTEPSRYNREPERQQQENRQQMDQRYNRPPERQQPQPMNRPQPQPQPQQQRPQPQPQPQPMNRPQPQAQPQPQRAQPAQPAQKEEREIRRR
jgi:hypothetical protein